MARCPNCGSESFHYELRSAGTKSKTNYYRTGVKHSWIVPAGQKRYRSQRKQASVGICPNCGYIEERHEKGCLFYLLCLLFLPISISVWFFKTNAISLDKKRRAMIIAAFWVLFCVFVGIVNSKESKPQQSSNSVEYTEYAPLSDFEYYVDNESVILKDYKGHSSVVRISPEYSIDGTPMPVIGLDGTFTLKSVESVIVPEGVTTIVHNTFNSSGIKYLFLPVSLTDFSGWNYFHDMKKLYYGGTREQWEALYTGERSQLDVVQIICEATPESISE